MPRQYAEGRHQVRNGTSPHREREELLRPVLDKLQVGHKAQDT